MLGGTDKVERSPAAIQLPSSRRSTPSSMSISSISSTKRGLPSAASAILPRTSSPSSVRPSRFSIRMPHSSSASGSSRMVAALSLPPPQAGRKSRSSARPMQTSRIGASRDQSAMCSTRSRNVGSAHWTSSKTITSGCSRACASKSLRTAQNVSSPPADVSVTPIAPPTRSATRCASSSPPSRAAIAATMSSPVRLLTTSTSGQKVMPSP